MVFFCGILVIISRHRFTYNLQKFKCTNNNSINNIDNIEKKEIEGPV